ESDSRGGACAGSDSDCHRVVPAAPARVRVAKDDKKKNKGTPSGHDDVVDLAARIGARPSSSPEPTPPEAGPSAEPPPPPTRLGAPIPSPPKPRLVPAKEDRAQSAIIQKALVEESQKPEPAIPSPRAAPGPG